MNSLFSSYSIPIFFDPSTTAHYTSVIESDHLQRSLAIVNELSLIIDTFPSHNVKCCFFRHQSNTNETIALNFPENFKLDSIPAGGWLLSPIGTGADFCYWIPQPATFRSLDHHERILKETRLHSSAPLF